jgi:hypothetical protein
MPSRPPSEPLLEVGDRLSREERYERMPYLRTHGLESPEHEGFVAGR